MTCKECPLGCTTELFRSHRAAVLVIAFAANSLPMLTLDQQGYCNVWDYVASDLTSFGWFVPTRRFRLNCSVMGWLPVPGATIKVLFFDDKRANNDRDKNQRVMSNQERSEVRQKWMKKIQVLGLSPFPWHTDTVNDDGVIINTYAPQTVTPLTLIMSLNISLT